MGSHTDDECRAIGRIGADLLAQGVRDRGRITTYRAPMATRGRRDGTWVYGRRGRACRECGTPIRSRGQGDANRTTYWCVTCQR